MLELKEYQLRCLDAFRRFFRRCLATGYPAAAFAEVAGETLEGAAYRALDQYPGLAATPYVCLRVPTGGGKTLLACHSIALAQREYLHCDGGLVLWLVPSTAILVQTLRALKERAHPYAQALRRDLGDYTVLDIAAALEVGRGDLEGRTCILLSTIQAFRRENKDGLRVYRPNGHLQSLFPAGPAADLDFTPIDRTIAQNAP